jgi:DNA topoisomerase-3
VVKKTAGRILKLILQKLLLLPPPFPDFQKKSPSFSASALQKSTNSAAPRGSFYAAYKEQGYARQHADWLTGMNITRLISLKCGKLLTFGRVQTAVPGAVYEREKAFAEFKNIFDKLKLIYTVEARDAEESAVSADNKKLFNSAEL